MTARPLTQEHQPLTVLTVPPNMTKQVSTEAMKGPLSLPPSKIRSHGLFNAPRMGWVSSGAVGLGVDEQETH